MVGIDNLVNRESEIIRELDTSNTKHLPELLDIAKSLCSMYEPCKCGFISKHKETGICKECDNHEKHRN